MRKNHQPEFMKARTYNPGKLFLCSLKKGDDLLAGIESWCRKNRIEIGVINIIGALSSAALGFYDQKAKTYRTMHLEEPVEIASGFGNVSLKGGFPFCHIHLVVSDNKGKAFGGHLMPGCKVFASEIHLVELEGQALVRMPDDITGLSLWHYEGERPQERGGE